MADPPRILVWAGFRTHLLIPHDVVGTIHDSDHPAWPGLTRNGGMYFRDGAPIVEVAHIGGDQFTRVSARALTEIWIQEPCLSVEIAGDGTWQGIGRRGATSRRYPLRQKDAHRSTVHFSRVRTNPNYTVAVEYLDEYARMRFRSDGGFTKLLNQPPGHVPWQGCQVFSEGYELQGAFVTEEVLRRWELAGKPPNIGQLYFLGWTGGPGCVVNAEGRTPPPGHDVTETDGYNLLWQPRSWRRLRKGDVISQTLSVRSL